ncbi:DUF1194 domain-containing protein [Neptunomonas sp.]|uniref:DUF1194 domain-containing protein n=1 Tax=Neptunomonas sp. TaxID=1971898 RepID=UPI0025CD6B42|nr:DUF1194 domain-containing protein [Neptunomonas sp.]
MRKSLIATAILAAALTTNANAAVMVDLELQLLADVSGSVDSSEYALQLAGYSNAFRSAAVVNSILAGTNGGIAVQYIEWSGSSQQSTNIDWTLINSLASATAFADALDATTRAFSGSTAIGSAINYGSGLFANNNFDAFRQVMDVSGDGANNTGASTSAARDAALAAGVDTINGITIGTENGLAAFYQNNVVGGTNAFQLHATGFDTFTFGIERKLIQEITSTVPEPSSIALLGLGLLGLGGLRRKNKASK